MPTTSRAGRELFATMHTQTQFALEQVLSGGNIGGVWDAYTYQLPGFTGKKTMEAMLVGPPPGLQEWTGARPHKQLRGYTHSATTKKYVATLDIPVSDYLSAGADAIVARVKSMLAAAQTNSLGQIIHDFAFPAIASTPTAYDGIGLFGTHVHAGSTAGTAVNHSSTAFGATAIEAADTFASTIKNEEGMLLGISYDTIRVGEKLRNSAMALFDARASERVIAVDNTGAETGTRVAAASSYNVFQGRKRIIVDPFETTLRYTLHDTKVAPQDKPIWLGFSRDFELQQQTTPESTSVFEHDMVSFGVVVEFALMAVGWQSAYGGDSDATS